LARLAELLFKFLTEHLGYRAHEVAEQLRRDYQRGGRRDLPEFLRSYVSAEGVELAPGARAPGLKRQARHLGTTMQRT
jgi:hypothetical protein